MSIQDYLKKIEDAGGGIMIIKDVKNALRKAEAAGANDLSNFDLWMDDMPSFRVVHVDANENGVALMLEFETVE